MRIVVLMITAVPSAWRTFSSAARFPSVVALAIGWSVADAADSTTELQFGGAAEWSLASGASRFGTNVSLEQELIKQQLQIELGVSWFHLSGSTEYEIDLAFKKPFYLGRGVELTVGLGPTWSHSTGTTEHTNAIDAELSLDFQFWLTGRWGWYVEPSYEFGASHNSERTAAINMGFLIGF